MSLSKKTLDHPVLTIIVFILLGIVGLFTLKDGQVSPAVPSAKRPLTSVFGTGTGMTTSLWPPAKSRKLGAKEKCNARSEEITEVQF